MSSFFHNAMLLLNGNIKCFVLKMIHSKNFNYNWMIRNGRKNRIAVKKNSFIKFGRNITIGAYSEISALNGGNITISDNVSFGKRNMIVSHNEITICKNTILAPDVKIYDHDHVITENGVERKKYITNPVYIGENCWIGANSIILRGSHIGNNCVIGAGSIIKGNYPDNSVIIQKRETIIKSR